MDIKTWIAANPDDRTYAHHLGGEEMADEVNVDMKVQYRMETSSAPSLGQVVGTQWLIVDTSVQDEEKRYIHSDKIIRKPGEPLEFTWSKPGQYVVFAVLILSGQTSLTARRTVFVEPVEKFLDTMLAAARQSGPTDPHAALMAVNKSLRLFDTLGQRAPSADPKQRHRDETFRKSHAAYAEALKKRLASTEGTTRYEIRAVYKATEDGSEHTLRLFLACNDKAPNPDKGPGPHVPPNPPGPAPLPVPPPDIVPKTWKVVDWTEPTVPIFSREYDAIGSEDSSAINSAIRRWALDARYPDGKVIWEIPDAVLTELKKRDLHVVGSGQFAVKNPTKPVLFVFETIAMVAGFVAMAVAAMAPVPGSSIVAALIWTSVFSSAASAALNIHARHEQGINDTRADVFDMMTVATSLIGAGGWARGARVVAETSGGLVKGFLVAQVSMDAIQGVIITQEYLDDINAAADDKTMGVQARSVRILNILGKAVAHLGLMVINFRSSATDRARIKEQSKKTTWGRSPEDRLNALKNPEEHVDLTRKELKTPPVEGNVPANAEGGSTTKVHPPAGRAHAETVRVKKPAKPPNERGIRTKDDVAFSDLAKEKGWHIIVRNSNKDAVKFIGKEGYAPKPEALKAKTIKEGMGAKPENVGLASANPKDPRLIEMYQSDPKLGSYEKFVEKLKKDNFFVSGPEDDFVVYRFEDDGPKKVKTRYFSDVDLHGVYTKDGEIVKVTGNVQDKINGKLRTKLVMHGAQDEWVDRLSKEAGPNRGPQKDATAYSPSGGSEQLDTIADMKAYYLAHGLPWQQTWNGEY